MSSAAARVAAAAFAAVALLPWPARGDALAEAEREAATLEDRLRLLEVTSSLPDDSAAIRAARRFHEGETQYLLGDWLHAAILLSDTVDEPSFQRSKDQPTALFYLADALRRQGAYGTARVQYAAYLALPTAEHRGDAIAGALECAVKARRTDLVEPLLADAERTFQGDPPPVVRYLGAKALFHRTDLPAADRIARAMAAFAAVPAPYLQQAAYFQGVLEVERGDLAAAAERFEACHRAQAQDDRQRETKDLCALALGRVHGEMGHAADALEWYARVPRESPHFEDALYEMAWAYVRAKQYDPALRTASLIADLSPESPVAPEATILQGHLLLKLGRYAEATDAYSRVINRYAPVRDEIDAILTMHEDPVRYFNELIGQQGKAFDVATLLPPVAVKWASSSKEVATALDLASALDAGRRDLADSDALADRIDALLARSNGLDAFPLLQQAYATAQATLNDAAVLDGRAATAAVEAGRGALDAETRAELDRAHGERLAMQARLDLLPRSAEQVLSRLERMRAEIDRVDREAFRLEYVVDSSNAAISGTEAWLERHRAEITVDPEGRQELTDELRKQRAVVGDYEETLRGLRREVALARDAASGSGAVDEEARLRGAYLELVAKERELLGRGRAGLGAGDLARLDRAGALSDRLDAAQARAAAIAAKVSADAVRRAGELRGRVALEKQAIAQHARALDGVQGDTKDLVGRIAYRSFSAVRSQFYRLVLKADVGLVDVAWSRKRVRLDKIQQLSQQKSVELQQLDSDYRELLREDSP